MTSPPNRVAASEPLPEALRGLFWEYDFDELSWKEDLDLIFKRVLSVGPWDTVLWLRRRSGDPVVRDWIREHRGRWLSRRQLRFWQLILEPAARGGGRLAGGAGAGPLGAAVGGLSFHPEVLETQQLRALGATGPSLTTRGFRLGGGTGLALLLGHRQSEDFDWFSTESTGDPMLLARELQDEGVPLQVQQVARGTIHGTVEGVRLSLLEFGYPLLAEPIRWPERGIDLLYSLVYFEDAEQERMPKMIWDIEWREVRERIESWVQELASG